MPRPNIVFILSDDQGAWAMHCAGTPELVTPHMDRLAAEGVRFDNFFCASPVCSPARASLLTGRMPSAHGVHDWLLSGNFDAARFAEQEKDNPYGCADETEPISYLEGMPAYTDILAQRGYNCSLSGKWHMGDSVTPQHGFSSWYTLGMGGCFYYHPDIVENGNITVRHGEYVTDLITDRAVSEIHRLSMENAPFYLSVHYTAPHAPWGAKEHPQHWIDFYDSCDFASIPDVPDHPDMVTGPVYHTPRRHENLRGYFAAISAMDEGIGRILAALEEEGNLNETLVIFTGDNGMSMGHHGIWGKGNGTWPMNMYDTAVKVPFILRYPALTPEPGRVESALVSACDLFPTLAELTGGYSPAPHLPGHSILPLLRGEANGRQDIVICDEYGPVRMIRTREWKYVHRYPYGPHELYDLAHDPDELHNLAGEEALQPTLLSLRKRLFAYFAKWSIPELDGAHEPVTGSGQRCRPGVYANRPDVYAPPPLTRKEQPDPPTL